jgi:hypothetical protein
LTPRVLERGAATKDSYRMNRTGLGRQRTVAFPIVACAVLGLLGACSSRAWRFAAAIRGACSTPPHTAIVVKLGGNGLGEHRAGGGHRPAR